jgi:hypothetical protein
MPGNRANPGGRPKAAQSFTSRAKELSVEVLEHFAKLARGRSMAAVRAGELVLAYAHGKPQQNLAVTATRLAELPEEFVGAAAGVLERALAEDADAGASAGATDTETVALAEIPESVRALDAEVLDVSPAVVPRTGGTGGGQ